MRICINGKIFLMNLLLSSTVNIVIKILYFGRMEGGNWYYTVVAFTKKINGLSSTCIITTFINIPVHLIETCINRNMFYWNICSLVSAPRVLSYIGGETYPALALVNYTSCA